MVVFVVVFGIRTTRARGRGGIGRCGRRGDVVVVVLLLSLFSFPQLLLPIRNLIPTLPTPPPPPPTTTAAAHPPVPAHLLPEKRAP